MLRILGSFYWYKKSKAHDAMIKREQEKYRGWFTDRKDYPSFYGRIAAASNSDKPDDVIKKEFLLHFCMAKFAPQTVAQSLKFTAKEFPILLEAINWHKTNIFIDDDSEGYLYLLGEYEKENAKRKKKGQAEKLEDFFTFKRALRTNALRETL